MKLSIIGATYKGRFLGLDGQECINLYPEISASAEAKNVASLMGTPGLRKLLAINSNSGCRGFFTTARDRLLMVAGAKLYEIDKDHTITVRGTLQSSEGSVCFAEIDKQPDPSTAAVSQVMIVDGLKGYIFNTQLNTFVTITGDYFPGTSVISQNGFFIQNINDSNKFIYSNYLDGVNWESSLNYFAAESSPDPILSIKLLNNQLWLMGSKTIEIWTFTGQSAQLWTRSGVGFINTGTTGRTSSTLINGHIFWVGSDQGQNIIWHSGGSYSPERVSTHAVEYILSTLGDLSDCVCYSYQQEGHQHIVFNFIGGNRTLVYDMTTSLWHERGSFNPASGQNNRHRVTYVVNWDSKVIAGDSANDNVYELSLDQYTDDGRLIKRIRTCPHIHNERHRVYFHQLEIDCAKGYGLTGAGYGSDPKIMLTYSNDGGYTYSPNEIWGSTGKVGERINRVRFNKLGMSRDRVFRLTMTDPVRWCLIDARCDLTPEAP